MLTTNHFAFPLYLLDIEPSQVPAVVRAYSSNEILMWDIRIRATIISMCKVKISSLGEHVALGVILRPVGVTNHLSLAWNMIYSLR